MWNTGVWAPKGRSDLRLSGRRNATITDIIDWLARSLENYVYREELFPSRFHGYDALRKHAGRGHASIWGFSICGTSEQTAWTSVATTSGWRLP
jgi:hypothetical protein